MRAEKAAVCWGQDWVSSSIQSTFWWTKWTRWLWQPAFCITFPQGLVKPGRTQAVIGGWKCAAIKWPFEPRWSGGICCVGLYTFILRPEHRQHCLSALHCLHQTADADPWTSWFCYSVKIFGGRSDVTFHIFTKQILQFWIDNYVCVNIIFQLLM